MRHRVTTCLLAALAAAPFSAPMSAPLSAQFFGPPTLNITADPATATIYKLKVQDNSLVSLGVGNARVKLEKGNPNTIIVRQEGYRDVIRSFPTDADYKDKNFMMVLTKRVVKLQVLPYDAKVFENGVLTFERGGADNRGKGNYEIEVSLGQATTIEISKVGFATVKRLYRWDKGGDLPPIADRVEMVDRKVSVTTTPDRAELLSNDTKIGDGDADFVIKRGTCATLVARKSGWMPASQNWCNKEGEAEPPSSWRMVLPGRMVNLSTPPNARIWVNQVAVATGNFPVSVPDSTCVNVVVRLASYLSEYRDYCSMTNRPLPPADESITLRPDDSYAASIASDQANVNVTLEVGKSFTEEAAWRLLASIVLTHFDVLENSDSQTGYLRTAWQVKTYGDSRVLIRTRVIVKRSNDQPLRYTIKIVSERNDWPGASVKDDEKFVSWDRLLNTYKDVISEAQSRLTGR